MVGPVATGRYFKEINPLGNIYSERESRPWKKKKTGAGLLPLFVLVVQPHSVKNSGKRICPREQCTKPPFKQWRRSKRRRLLLHGVTSINRVDFNMFSCIDAQLDKTTVD